MQGLAVQAAAVALMLARKQVRLATPVDIHPLKVMRAAATQALATLTLLEVAAGRAQSVRTLPVHQQAAMAVLERQPPFLDHR